jgi:hypothetical protein
MPPALISLIGVCGIRIIWIFAVFPSHHTFSGLMKVYPLSLSVAAVTTFVMLLIMRPSRRLRTGG